MYSRNTAMIAMLPYTLVNQIHLHPNEIPPKKGF
jgi:hypothetical protein